MRPFQISQSFDGLVGPCSRSKFTLVSEEKSGPVPVSGGLGWDETVRIGSPAFVVVYERCQSAACFEAACVADNDCYSHVLVLVRPFRGRLRDCAVHPLKLLFSLRMF